jgi:hypothetical protein
MTHPRTLYAGRMRTFRDWLAEHYDIAPDTGDGARFVCKHCDVRTGYPGKHAAEVHGDHSAVAVAQ